MGSREKIKSLEWHGFLFFRVNMKQEMDLKSKQIKCKVLPKFNCPTDRPFG